MNIIIIIIILYFYHMSFVFKGSHPQRPPVHPTLSIESEKVSRGRDFRAAVIDNINNNPSSTTANDSFHGTSVSLVRQAENEGEMRMLSESVDTSTRKYGVTQLPADYTHIFPVPCPPSEQLMPLLQGHSHLEEMESYDCKKRGLEDYIHSAGNSNHHK